MPSFHRSPSLPLFPLPPSLPFTASALFFELFAVLFRCSVWGVVCVCARVRVVCVCVRARICICRQILLAKGRDADKGFKGEMMHWRAHTNAANFGGGERASERASERERFAHVCACMWKTQRDAASAPILRTATQCAETEDIRSFLFAHQHKMRVAQRIQTRALTWFRALFALLLLNTSSATDLVKPCFCTQVAGFLVLCSSIPSISYTHLVAKESFAHGLTLQSQRAPPTRPRQDCKGTLPRSRLPSSP